MNLWLPILPLCDINVIENQYDETVTVVSAEGIRRKGKYGIVIVHEGDTVYQPVGDMLIAQTATESGCLDALWESTGGVTKPYDSGDDISDPYFNSLHIAAKSFVIDDILSSTCYEQMVADCESFSLIDLADSLVTAHRNNGTLDQLLKDTLR